MDHLAPNAFSVTPGDDWAAAYRFANRLLRGGARVLVATDTIGPSTIERGSFVVPLSRAFDPWFDSEVTAEDVLRVADDSGVELVPLTEADRGIAAPVRLTRVGLYGGGGAPFNQAAILAACGFPVRFLSDAEVRAGLLAEVDVFVMPGGGFRGMHGQIEPLGEAGCRAIADFVRAGGMYIGCCAGSYDCIVNSEDFLRSCPAQGQLQLLNAGPWRSDGAVEFLHLQSPGVGVVKARNVRPEHPVMYGMPAEFEIAHYNGPVLDPLPERVVEGASAAMGLAAFGGWTERFTPAEAFAGPIASDAPTHLGRAVEAGRFSIMAGELGLGRVVAFGSHPEFGFDLPMIKWGQPARMLANAVMWQAASGRKGPLSPPAPAGREDGGSTRLAGGRVGLPVGSALCEVPVATTALSERVQALRERSKGTTPSWLEPDYALSVFGLPPEEIWRQALDDIERLAGEVTALANRLHSRVQEIVADRNWTGSAPMLDALNQIERWVLDERTAEWEQDGGYQGVLALLRTAARMCDAALANWDIALGPPAGPYGYPHENPYHLVAGSYLAAIGCVAGAAQLLRALDDELSVAGCQLSIASMDRVPLATGN